jgi:hypothetical protein
MSTEVAAATIAALAALFGTALGAYVSLVQARPERLLVAELYRDNAAAFQKLFSLTVLAAASRADEISVEDRKTLVRLLTEWYYKDGNGIFLNNAARDSFFEFRRRLLTKEEAKGLGYDIKWLEGYAYGSSDDMMKCIKSRASALRTELKTQLGVYRIEELFARKFAE